MRNIFCSFEDEYFIRVRVWGKCQNSASALHLYPITEKEEIGIDLTTDIDMTFLLLSFQEATR